MNQIWIVLVFGLVIIGQTYNDTLFFQNKDTYNLNLDAYKGRKLEFNFTNQTDNQFAIDFQENQKNPQPLNLGTDQFKHIINYPLQSQSVLVALTTKNELVFLDKDMKVLSRTALTDTQQSWSSQTYDCHQLSWFQLPQISGVVVLCESSGERRWDQRSSGFVFLRVFCNAALTSCQLYQANDNFALAPQDCPSPLLTSQIETSQWLVVQCSNNQVRMLKMDYVLFQDYRQSYYELQLADTGSLMNGFSSVGMKNVKKVMFTGLNTIAILDQLKGLYIAKFTYDSKSGLSVRLADNLNFVPNEGEQFLTMTFTLSKISNDQILLDTGSFIISQSLILVSDLFLYEILLKDTIIEGTTDVVQEILVQDKMNMKKRFQILDQIKQIQIVYDNYYYYVCVTTVSTQNKCLRLTKHEDRQWYSIHIIISQPQKEIMYDAAGQTPVMLGVNNPLGMSYNQTKILLFTKLGSNAAVTVVLNQQNILNIQFTGSDLYQNELIITDLENKESSSYMIVGTNSDVPTVYVMPNPPNSQFASSQGDMLIFDHVRGPDIKAKVLKLEHVDNSPSFLAGKIDVEIPVKYTTSFVEGQQYILSDDIYQRTMKNSMYNQSFQDSKEIITVVQKADFQLSFIIFVLGQTNTENYNLVEVSVQQTQFNGRKIANILVVRNNFVIQYEGSSIPEYLLINLRKSKISKYTTTQSVRSLQISDKYVSFKFLNNVRFNTIFALINFENGAQSLVYTSLLKGGPLYQIALDRIYRDLDLTFLLEGIILASNDKCLYYLKLSKLMIQDRYTITSTQMTFENPLSNDFTFAIVDQRYVKKPLLVIVTTEINLYQLNNFKVKIDLLATLPLFNYTISSKQFTLNQEMLLVLVESGDGQLFYFTYDLTTTGQDRLYKSVSLEGSVVTLAMRQTSIAINLHLYCLTQLWQIEKFTLICYQDKSINVNLKQIANNQVYTNFTFPSQFSSFESSSIVVGNYEMQGSFYYCETLISQVGDPKKNPVIQIQKNQTNLNPQNYFQGPVLDYQLSGKDSKYLTLQPFISQKNVSLNLDDNQQIVDVKVNIDFMVTIGDKHISVTQVTVNLTSSASTIITYEDLNQILKSKGKTNVTTCKKIFLQPLVQDFVDRSYILTLVCTINQVGNSEFDQILFVTLTVNGDIKTSFENRILFPKFLSEDPVLLTGRNFISTYNMKMINYVFSNQSFVSVTSVVSQNLRYSPFKIREDDDDIVAILFGLFDSKVADVQTVRLREIGAQDFNMDRLLVNGLQLECLQNCTYAPASKGTTQIALFFNDLKNCTLYFATLQITYDLTNLKSTTLQIIKWSSMDIREKVNQVSTQKFDINYINTMVEIREDNLFIQVTTNSAAFDFTTDFDLTEMKNIDSIFRQYTDCPNPQGSLHSSLSDYLTISCQNNTRFEEYQNTYVKLFIRNQSQIETQLASVVQAIKIDDELIYINIQENQMGTDQFHLTTLEKINGQLGQLRLTTYLISNSSTIKLTEDATKKEYDVDYCASNLYNSGAFVCSSMLVSTNVSPRPGPTPGPTPPGPTPVPDEQAGSFYLDFFLFVLLPLAIVLLVYVLGTYLYKIGKKNRIETYKVHALNENLKLNQSYQGTEEKNSVFDSIY